MTNVSYLFALPAPSETVAVGSGGPFIMITSPKYRAAWSWAPENVRNISGPWPAGRVAKRSGFQLLAMAATWDGLAGERERLLSEQATETQLRFTTGAAASGPARERSTDKAALPSSLAGAIRVRFRVGPCARKREINQSQRASFVVAARFCCMENAPSVTKKRPRLLLIFVSASVISLVSSFSLLAAAVIIH